MTRHNPMLPEYSNAAVGLTNIPDPIITPIIILTAAKRPMFCFNPTSEFSSLTAAIFQEKKATEGKSERIIKVPSYNQRRQSNLCL